jgi:hypothetical protein
VVPFDGGVVEAMRSGASVLFFIMAFHAAPDVHVRQLFIP